VGSEILPRKEKNRPPEVNATLKSMAWKASATGICCSEVFGFVGCGPVQKPTIGSAEDVSGRDLKPN